MPQPVRSATADGFEGNEFGNSYIFDEDNLEKFDIMENSRLKSLIINDDSDLRSPLDLIQVLILHPWAVLFSASLLTEV